MPGLRSSSKDVLPVIYSYQLSILVKKVFHGSYGRLPIVFLLSILKKRVLLVNIAGMYGTNVIVRTFLTIAYISKPTRNCHNKNQRGWDLVYTIPQIKYIVYIGYNFTQ